MNLHTDKKLFSQTILATAKNTNINEIFIEKDYWITLILSRLSESRYASQTVFKGGTSLSKGYGLISRFSEDVDIAIIEQKEKSGNVVKTIIRTVEKQISAGLKEIVVDDVTSKGSRYRKSVFEYESTIQKNPSNRLMLEVNSFANPYPFQSMLIKSFVYDFLISTDNKKLIDKFGLSPFEINVLSKEQTLLEKLVSLIRFSFDDNTSAALSSKIRHFYDLYFLFNDEECNGFIKSKEFKS
ncbi:MAG: nucleotidyl transferase AbiEii/AbiGii toxin family protein, partial [Ignavibacteria bacterium]|nr:nucleotidyl transferase AbiEii/AbiGii toxin family protein [Ignavibacteria bacterium]